MRIVTLIGQILFMATTILGLVFTLFMLASPFIRHITKS